MNFSNLKEEITTVKHKSRRAIASRIGSSLTVMMLVFTMCFGMAVTTVSAAASTRAEYIYENNGKDSLVYVSIGDSMTNGYGLEGYDGMSGIANYANESYANQFAAWLAGY